MELQLATRETASLDATTAEADHGTQRLPKGWQVGWNCNIGGPLGHPVRIELVLLNPAFGVALLGCENWVEGADDVLRQRLAEAQFGAVFGGYLPVLNGMIEPQDLPRLVSILMDAFGHLQPLDLAGGDAWVSTVSRLVVPECRCWTDNLQGLAPVSGSSHGTQAETDRSTWRAEPAAVVPLRRVTAPQPKDAEIEQTLPLPYSTHITRRRWPWALGALGLTVVMVLSLELSSTGDPDLDVSSAMPDGAMLSALPIAAEVASQARDLAKAASVDATLSPATATQPEAAPAATGPALLVPSIASGRASVAPPRGPKMLRAEAGRIVQAKLVKVKTAFAVKPASAVRMVAVKRGHARD